MTEHGLANALVVGLHGPDGISAYRADEGDTTQRGKVLGKRAPARPQGLRNSLLSNRRTGDTDEFEEAPRLQVQRSEST
jgi:hypothetical protein